jgi:5-methylthioadenosine/S-adenosylhomocysteine deaminase
MQQVDQIIHAQWVIPVVPTGTILHDHSIAIRNGKIVALAATRDINAGFQADSETTLGEHALLPGFINTHTHAAMSLMRGLADDLPLMSWLNDHIWPAEAKWVSNELVRQGTEQAVAEMIRSGTTCFNDMYFYPDAAAAVASAAGIRACVGLIVIDFPSAWASDWQEYFDKGLAVHDQYRDDDLVTTAFAPHAPYSVSNDPLQKILTYSDELDIPIHIHVHETQDEIDQGLANYGSRPLHRLQELGLLTPNLVAVHMTHLEDSEIQQFARSGAHVVHCPQSNMKLASGFCPVQQLMDNDINVALGTDGAASNNDLDMLAEMQSAAMLGKAVANDAAAVSAEAALAMATINGARALGIDDITGSLEVGKAADITAINLSQLETRPLYNPMSQIVYASDRSQVTDVWCNGKALMKDRQLQTLDMDKLLNNAHSWQEKLKHHHE